MGININERFFRTSDDVELKIIDFAQTHSEKAGIFIRERIAGLREERLR